MSYPVKPCGAAFMWLHCGKLAFIAFIGMVLYLQIKPLSVTSVSSVVKNIILIVTVIFPQIGFPLCPLSLCGENIFFYINPA
jgi:hypothetical protein